MTRREAQRLLRVSASKLNVGARTIRLNVHRLGRFALSELIRTMGWQNVQFGKAGPLKKPGYQVSSFQTGGRRAVLPHQQVALDASLLPGPPGSSPRGGLAASGPGSCLIRSSSGTTRSAQLALAGWKPT